MALDESPTRLKELQDEREIIMAGLKLGEELSSLRGTNSELRERVQKLKAENLALQSLASKKDCDQSLSKSMQSTKDSFASTLPPPASEEQILLDERVRLKEEHSLLWVQRAALDEEISRLTRDLSPDPKSAGKAPPTPPTSDIPGGISCEYGGLRREHTNLRSENERLRNELSAFDWNLDEIPDGSEELRREVLAAMLRASFFPTATTAKREHEAAKNDSAAPRAEGVFPAPSMASTY